MAIQRACQAIAKVRDQRIVIKVDSKAALLALKANYISSKTVEDCLLNLNRLGARNKVILQWIKAHVGHAGNEKADQLAKKGAEMAAMGPEPFLPIPASFWSNAIKGAFLDKWKDRWAGSSTARQTKLWFPKPDAKISLELKHLSRSDLGRLVQFITGHCNMNRHGNKKNPNLDPICRLCKEEEETPWHIVRECPCLISLRSSIFGLHILHLVEWTPRQLSGFLRNPTVECLMSALQ